MKEGVRISRRRKKVLRKQKFSLAQRVIGGGLKLSKDGWVSYWSTYSRSYKLSPTRISLAT